jgi:hypothetical protein
MLSFCYHGGRVVPHVLSGAIAKSKHRGTYRDHHILKTYFVHMKLVGLDTGLDLHSNVLDQQIFFLFVYYSKPFTLQWHVFREFFADLCQCTREIVLVRLAPISQ